MNIVQEFSPNVECMRAAFINLTKSDKAPRFTILSEADQHRIASDLLQVVNKVPAAGYKVMTRLYSGGKKPLEFHVYALGEKETNQEVSQGAKKACPFDQQIDSGSKNLAQRMKTVSGNVLVVTTQCVPNLLACSREQIVELYKEAEAVMAGENVQWSGATLSQVGEAGGQTVSHAHVHVTRGVQEEEGKKSDKK